MPPRNNPSRHVPHGTLAAAAGVGTRVVRQDIADGAPADTQEVYLAWRRANRRPDPSAPIPAGINSETARLRRAQAESEELDLAQRRGDLLPREDVRQLTLAMSGVFASQLEALPGRLANELAAINDPALIIAKLRAECRRIRDAAAAEIRELASGARDSGSGGEDGGAAPAADARPMGGPDAPASAGLSGAGAVP